jgi:hypothetical protein
MVPVPGHNESMSGLEQAVDELDAATAARVRRALAWLGDHGAGARPSTELLRRFLTVELAQHWPGDHRERHEVAWALGDVCEQAGLDEQAALCRAPAVHDTIAVWHWVRSFPDVPAGFWVPALGTLEHPPEVPHRAALSLSSTRALLETVGDGLRLTATGQLPLPTVLALDDRFRWTEDFPWMAAGQESDVAPLRFLHEHLLAQGLLHRDGDLLARTALGAACTRSTARLWRAVVDPAPRWSQQFERDALGVVAASVLRSADFTLGRVGEQAGHVLAGKWRPAARSSVFDGAARVVQAWYQLGVPLGWWDTGRGPADRRPNPFGRAAAQAVFRAVAGRTVRE